VAINTKPPVRTPEAAAKYKAYKARGPQEQQMWEVWNTKDRKPKYLKPLIASLDNIIDREARNRAGGTGGSIPFPAMKNEVRKAAIRGIETYDPNKGTKLTTHVRNNLMRVTGFVAANRNASGYTPKSRIDKYQYFQNAQNDLKNQLGRPPTFAELDSATPDMSRNDVKRMLKEVRPEVFSDMGTEFEDGRTLDPAQQKLRLYRAKLTPAEQRVADVLFSGQFKSNNAAAKSLKMTPVQLSKIKSSINKKVPK